MIAIGGVILAGIIAFLFGYFVKLLWNWLMPSIFGLGTITYWQAFGLVILAKILFGSFGNYHESSHKKHIHDKADSRWHKWMGFNDEKWKPKGSYKNWRYYEKYWEAEGKKAFEDYIERIAKEEKK